MRGEEPGGGGVNDRQLRFVEEYLVDLNATQAAIRAGYSEKTAYSIGQRLLKDVEVAAAIAKAQAARSEKTEITAERVLQELWDIATADPNELVQFRRGACSSCWSIEEDEIEDELEEQAHGGALRRSRAAGLAMLQGGIKDPNPDCEVCGGEGTGRAYIPDTRTLEGKARKLYAGVKVTKEGVEVKMHDRAAALVHVGKHLGMFTDKLDLNVTGSLASDIEEARRRVRTGS